MHIVIFVTAKNSQEANKIARALIERKLAACVNVTGKLKSLFWWQGKVDRANEVLLIIKSKKNKLAKIIKAVKSLHSYETPEIIALPIIAGDRFYLRWIDGTVN